MAGGVQTTARDWLALLLTLPVVGWCGWPIHRATLRNLRHRTTTMDTLISMGVAAALGWSLVALLAPSVTDHLYLEVAAGVTLFILLGRWLEARAKRRAVDGAARARRPAASRTWPCSTDAGEQRVPLQALRVGDVFVVRPGELIATDGVVREGHSAVDRSLLTGESMPVEIGPGRRGGRGRR